MNRSKVQQLSFEVFPPKSSRGSKNLLRSAERLAAFEPSFFSVTHGAGGSARDGTLDTVRLLRAQGYKTVPHITCGFDSLEDLNSLLSVYENEGVNEMVVLSGDAKPGLTGEPPPLRSASDLIGRIREFTGNQFKLNVGCYPEVHPREESLLADLQRLKGKLDAGADACISQYFFNADAYSSYVRSCRKLGMNQDIIPGIMPISNVTNLIEFSRKCGAEIPRWLLLQLRDKESDAKDLRHFVAEVVANLCRRLLSDGSPGLHFYTLNLARPTQAILNRLFQT